MTQTRLPRVRALVLALGFAVAALSPVQARDAANDAATAPVQADIPFEQFTLPNGLRVVVHTDRKAPIVAVNVWYHVGAKNELPGRTGFAHLFEHLMFQSSENHKGEFFTPFELVGATDQNGTTNSDRTNYFQNVPTTALDMALWMESDRMGHFLGAVTQEVLDEQRGVVQNEKRQGENQPYGQVFQRLLKASYPEGHPYSWPVIGSMSDLDAASLEDVQNFFKSWYGPNNAVLVLAGDIDVATAKEKVTRFFGDIPAGPTLAQPAVDPAARTDSTRDEFTDRVPQARVYRAWNIAEYGQADVDRLQLVSQVLGGSRASRLDKRLVHGDKIADRVSAGAWGNQLGGLFFIQVDVKAGVDPDVVEKAIDEEVRRLITEGPSASELEQARTSFKAGFIRGIERIGGFGGKADALAECTVYMGDPGCFRESLATIESATADDLMAAGQRWLSRGDHTIVVTPGERVPTVEDASLAHPDMPEVPAADPKYTTVASDVDRSKGPPVTTEFPDLVFPELKRAELSNGTTLVLAERPGLPVVQMSLQLPGGYVADVGRKLGTASFTMGMLDEGAGKYGALAFGDEAERLGASLGSSASLDGASAYLSALKENLDPSVALFATMLRMPRFDDAEIERVRQGWISSIRQEKARPNSAASRLLPPLLYGKGHPYAIPFSGTGDEASIASLTRDDLLAYHRDFVRPEGSTLIVVGDTTLDEIVPVLEKHLGNWRGQGEAPALPSIDAVALPQSPRVFLVDQPGAIQANIFVGQLAPSTMDEKATEFEIANSVLGGEFSSRLNMNLREDKHWAYGSYSFVQAARGQRPWMAFAAVQIDKTAESMAELQREISQYATGEAPAKAEEVTKIQATEIRSLPGSYETANAVLGAIGGIVRYQRPDDYVVQRKAKIEALTPEIVNTAAATLQPGSLTWVVVGDLSQIEEGVRALGLGEVQVIDADGNPVAGK
ncbi:M16 family metallopeptidase [Arenimonas caeni]|jgi:predicted Zn-dependent peptidase|uniref:Peptidase M16 n=1 Tax=Arenimonas caeni TaxID=2058085 RepID=A0A2P6M979_9GAMM|nr:pitrilysin family protein [Arenimonas caeni]MDY0022374.1 pitrilysin family protein [Arenimonas caeni]PRH82508.1 peptidase M16 [Arenimonas caeni]